jgi:conjugative relaxase-like TrwC/TraI family protein
VRPWKLAAQSDCPSRGLSGCPCKVLSIGKLAAGQAKYYLDQAEVRVDTVQSIGEGVEDYYAGGAEARGVWVGTAASALGLSGAVDGDALRHVLAGLDPRDGSLLRDSASPVRVAGFDLTFSAPKSVSVVFALGHPKIRGAVRGAHDQAAREAIAYLEGSATAVRRGHGGARVEPAAGLIAAAFRHRTSRAGDPQLHTHVLVANLGRGPDGRWSALDGRRLYAHARAASFVYQAVLRAELTRTLGLEWLPVRNGIADLVGVPKPVLRAFSRRRAEITAAMAERATSGPRAAEAAALATRQAKGTGETVADLEAAWHERAAELGFGREDLERLLGRVRGVELDERMWQRAFDHLASPLGLTRRASTFSRRDVIQALCERVPAGAHVDARVLEAAADRFLASAYAVALLPERGEGEAYRRRDGRLLPIQRDELVYSTPELLALEQQLIETVGGSRASGAGLATERAVDAAVASRPTFSGEQRAMLEHLCLGGDAVSVVVGKAGTGKTFALGAAREAWQSAGLPVLGVAVARRAARELERDAGIASTSVAALLRDLQGRGPAALPEECVLVVDEAGMVPTRQLAELVEATAAAHGKLVLVGDHRQLPELEAGGAFRGLAQRGLAIELTENHRQVNRWERVALDDVRDGRAEAAIALYEQHDRITVDDTDERSRERMVADWWAAAGALGRSVMLAQRRDDVADLNARARDHLRAAGELGERELRLPGGHFAVGDHVIAKRNDLRRGIVNGERGRVVAVDLEGQTLTLDCQGEHLKLDANYLLDRTAHGDPTLLHGYAMTVHVAQGATVDHAFVLAGPGLNRELGYTALSRGRHTNRLYTARAPDASRAEYAPAAPQRNDPIARLAAQLGTSSATTLAIDTGGPERGWDHSLGEATRLHADATQRRRAAEASHARWLPGRRKELVQLRRAEALAAGRVEDLRRQQAERGHAARPFVTERELGDRGAQMREQLAERRLQRERSRECGRGLER